MTKRKKLNILNITLFPVFPPNYGGAIGFYYIPLELAKRGHKISFLTIKENEKEIDYSEFENIFQNNIYVSKKNRFKALISSIPYSCKRFSPSKKEKQEILEKIKETKYDIIIFHNPYSALYYSFLKEFISREGISTLYYSHNIEKEYLLNNAKNSMSLVKKIFYHIESLKMAIFEKNFVKNFKLIFTVSALDQKKLISIHPASRIIWIKPIILIRNTDGIRPLSENVLSHINKFKYKILFTGLLSNEDNIFAAKWFSECVMPILRTTQNICFMIVGKNPSQKILELQKKYNDILVFANVESLIPYYKEADLVVLPLFNDAGIKIKLIEALKYRKKVVSRPEGVSGAGLSNVIPTATTSEEFAQKCIEVLEGKIDYTRIWEDFNIMYNNEEIINTFEEELYSLIESK